MKDDCNFHEQKTSTRRSWYHMVLKRDGNEGCKAISAKTFKDWEMKKWTAKHFNCYLQVFWMGLLLMIDLFSLILWLVSDLSISAICTLIFYNMYFVNLSTFFICIWLIEKTLDKNSKILLRSSINCQLYFIPDFRKSSKRKKERTERSSINWDARDFLKWYNVKQDVPFFSKKWTKFPP